MYNSTLPARLRILQITIFDFRLLFFAAAMGNGAEIFSHNSRH